MCIIFIFLNDLYLLIIIIINVSLFILHFRDDNWDENEHSCNENYKKKKYWSEFCSFDFGLKYDLDMIF